MNFVTGRLHPLTHRAPQRRDVEFGSWMARAGPAGEGECARALRWSQDRRRLAELDPRLLRDVGLSPGDVDRGVPFRKAGHHGLRAWLHARNPVRTGGV